MYFKENSRRYVCYYMEQKYIPEIEWLKLIVVEPVLWKHNFQIKKSEIVWLLSREKKKGITFKIIRFTFIKVAANRILMLFYES